MMKVSVIVPVYNVSKYVKRCLDSLANQTLSDIEIIVIDDCSNDGSDAILERYVNNDNFVILKNHTNMGIGYTRNRGLKLARGRYVAFVDGDDFVATNMLEKLYKKAESDNLDLTICRFHKLIELNDGRLERVTPKFIIPQFQNTSLAESPSLLLDINLAPWNKLYAKSLLQENTFPENLKFEDAIVVANAMANANRIGMLEDKLYYYLVRQNSESTTVDDRIFDIITIDDRIYKTLRQKKYYPKIQKYVEKKIISSLCFYIEQQRHLKDGGGNYSFIRAAEDYLDNNFCNWRNTT